MGLTQVRPNNVWKYKWTILGLVSGLEPRLLVSGLEPRLLVSGLEPRLLVSGLEPRLPLHRTHYQLVCNCVTVDPDQTFGWNPGYMTQSVTFQRDKGGWHSANANQHRLYHLFNFVHISQNDSLTLVPLRDSLNEHTLMCSWPSSDCCSHNLWWVTVCDHMTTY